MMSMRLFRRRSIFCMKRWMTLTCLRRRREGWLLNLGLILYGAGDGGVEGLARVVGVGAELGVATMMCLVAPAAEGEGRTVEVEGEGVDEVGLKLARLRLRRRASLLRNEPPMRGMPPCAELKQV